MSDQFDQNDNQLDGFEEPAAAPGGPKQSPQTFRVILTVFGVMFVVVILFLIAFLLLRPGNGGTTAEIARRNTENAQIAQNATATAYKASLEETVSAASTKAAVTNTPIIVVPTATNTSAVTATSVVAVATATSTLAPTATLVPPDALTKTAAAQTQVALGTKPVGGSGGTTGTPGTPAAGTPGTPAVTKTGLPATGLGDQTALPAMIGAAVLLLVVIIVARRLRLSN